VTGLRVFVAKVLVHHTLSNFWAAVHPETFLSSNHNGVVSHPAGNINEQESPSGRAITTDPACLDMS